MNILSIFNRSGVSLKSGMDPLKFIKCVVSVPGLTAQVPLLSVFVNSVKDLYDGYEKLKELLNTVNKTLNDAEKKLRQLEKALDKARLVYNQSAANLGAYTFTGVGSGPVIPTPVLPSALSVIQSAQMTLDTQIDTVIPKIKEQIASIEKQLDEYKQKMDNQVSKYIDTIITTGIKQ